MKNKNIIKICNSKITSWCNNISDKELVDDIKRDVIITGGAITSMLLDEDINDFDIYFKTPETLLKVIKYYAKDIDGVEVDNDNIKCYIKSDGYVNLYKQNKDKKYSVLFITDNAISLSNSIQIITRFYGKPIEIHKNFDFDHCKCSFDYINQDLNIPYKSLRAILDRELRYSGSLFPICSIMRMRKFIKRGWTINAAQIVKMAIQISELDLTDINILREQLVGVDSLYFIHLLKELECGDDELVDLNYVIELVDKIFDKELEFDF